MFYVTPVESTPEIQFTLEDVSITSSTYSNSYIFFGYGLDVNNFINIELKNNKFMFAEQDNPESFGYTVFLSDALNVSELVVSSNTFSTQYCFKNYQHENNLSPNFGLHSLSFSNNTFEILNSGFFCTINITQQDLEHTVQLTSLTFTSNTFIKEETLFQANYYIFLFELHSITLLTIDSLSSDATNNGLATISLLQIKTLNTTLVTASNIYLTSTSLFLSENCQVTLTNISLIDIHHSFSHLDNAKSNYANIMLVDSQLVAHNLSIIRSEIQGIYSFNSINQEILIRESQFINVSCTICSGAGLYAENSQVRIWGSNFTNCSALDGGALKLKDAGSATNSIWFCYFQGNQARYGGAIYTENTLIEIQLSNFTSNEASKYGGAIYYIGNSEKEYKLKFTDETGFVNNSAIIGGCVYYQELYPEVKNESILYYSGNSAQYFGAKFSCGYPYKLKILNDFLLNVTVVDSETNQEINTTSYFESNTSIFLENTVIIQDIGSGQEIQFNLTFLLSDEDDQIITDPYQFSENEIFLTLELEETEESNYSLYYSVSGETIIKEAFTEIQGVNISYYRYSSIIFSGKQNTLATLKVGSQAIKYKKSGDLNLYNDYEYLMYIYFRNCKTGEIVKSGFNSEKCSACSENYYSFNIYDDQCQNCPSNSYCPGGDQIWAYSGYWRAKDYTSKVVICGNALENCENTQTSQRILSELSIEIEVDEARKAVGNDLCKTGHVGFLCEACDEYGEYWGEKYYHSNEYSCERCANTWYPIFVFCMMSIIQFLSVVLSIQTNPNSKTELEKASTTITKMLVHHLQIISASYSIGMGEQLIIVKNYIQVNYSQLMEFLNFAGNSPEQASYSSDCLISQISSNKHFPFVRLYFAILFPIALAFIFIIAYSLQVVFKKIASCLLILFKKYYGKYKENQLKKKKELNFEFSDSLGDNNFYRISSATNQQTDYQQEILSDPEKPQDNQSDQLTQSPATELELNPQLAKQNIDLKKFKFSIIVSAVIFIFIYTQPTLVKLLISTTACKSVSLPDLDEKISYMHANPRYICFDSTHTFYFFFFLLPAMLLWFIVFPAGLFYLLERNKDKLQTCIEAQIRYLALIKEYNHGQYFWEFIKIFEKMGLSIIIVLLEREIQMKGMLLSMIIIFYLILLINIKPYRTFFFNQIDQVSTLIGFISIQIALYSYQNSNTFIILFCYAIITLINFVFVTRLAFLIIKIKLRIYIDKLFVLIHKFKLVIQRYKFRRQKTFSLDQESSRKEAAFLKKTDDEILKELSLFFFLPSQKQKINAVKQFTENFSRKQTTRRELSKDQLGKEELNCEDDILLSSDEVFMNVNKFNETLGVVQKNSDALPEIKLRQLTEKFIQLKKRNMTLKHQVKAAKRNFSSVSDQIPKKKEVFEKIYLLAQQGLKKSDEFFKEITQDWQDQGEKWHEKQQPKNKKENKIIQGVKDTQEILEILNQIEEKEGYKIMFEKIDNQCNELQQLSGNKDINPWECKYKESRVDLNKSKEDLAELTDAVENWKHEKLEEEISNIFKDDDDENNDSF